MKPKFKTYNKGTIVQYYGGNAAIYNSRGQDGHSGVDTILGWDKPIQADNDCYVYKVIKRHQSKEGWQGVYMLFDMGETAMEICQGHFNSILVNEGDWIPEGAVIGLEGNKGFVISGGVTITREMQDNGDRRGAHTHTSYRPCEKVTKTKSGEFYLLTSDGKKYRDKQGYYYRVVQKDNGYKGCIDPFLFAETKTTDKDRLSLLQKLIPWLFKRYSK